ncbi:putative cysteine desulfurase [Diplonema papillatum]|nr:putative cysteine desulfurase [Diplonema papillatum]|eukprot:gene16579-25427_t
MSLDMDFVRKQFPGLSDAEVLMDNAGGSQICRQSIDRITDYLVRCNVQHGASYDRSKQSVAAADAGVEAARVLLNAKEKCEVTLGPNTTSLFLYLSLAMTSQVKKGQDIIVTNSDHEANVGCWKKLAARTGATVKEWKVNTTTWKHEIADLKALISDNTYLVTVTSCSNIIGEVNDIAAYAKLAHEHGALICTDAVAFAPHRAMDVQATGVDFHASSLYKVFGPHIGVLYGKKSRMLELPGINHHFITDEMIPGKFQPGGFCHELAAGCAGILDYLSAVAVHHDAAYEQKTPRERVEFAFELFTRQEDVLCEKFLAFLRGKPGVRIIGGAECAAGRVPTISFAKEGLRSSEAMAATDSRSIGIRYGHFYAWQLIHDLGLLESDGIIRVSMAHYNTEAEVDRVIAALDEVL